ncbi:MAG: hypothetical protein VX899_17460 [Myxococcota bacterium]|nr:hypothetical protein [Myxococcota bacterium]
MLLLLLACTAGEDTGTVTEDTEPVEYPEPEGCEEVGVGFDGEDPPAIGDTWTVWPTCDGKAVMGGTVIRVTPVDMAYQDGITLTWEKAGEAEIMAQTGPDRAYLTVTVTE